MPKPTFTIKINANQELCVSGRIDITNVAQANVLGIATILAITINPVQINLSEVQYADSSCLAMLVAWIRSAKAQHKDVTVINMSQFMLDLGRVYGLDVILPINKTLKFHS